MKLKNEQLIKDWEQLRLEAYKPTPNDVWTIGWGHTKTARPGQVITKAQAQKLFEQDTAWVARVIEKYVKVPLTQNQYDATFSFIFNIGETNFAKSTFLRKLNRGDYEGAAAEFPRWNKQKGKVLRGLTRRRAHEMELFLSDMSDNHLIGNTRADGPKPHKSLGKSVEVIGGTVAALGGVSVAFKELLAGLPAINSEVLSTGLSVALITIGAIIIINRLKARRDGDR